MIDNIILSIYISSKYYIVYLYLYIIALKFIINNKYSQISK